MHLYAQHRISYDEYIEQDAPNDKKKKQQWIAGMTGVMPTHQIHKKAQQDVGLFYGFLFSQKDQKMTFS